MTAAKQWISILSESGLHALRSFIAGPTLFAFDLDGTLAPIVPDPSKIMIADEVRERMTRLCLVAKVTVLTGRSRDDARRYLGFKPLFIVGNHGAEGVPGWEEREVGFVQLCRGWEEQLQGLLPRTTQNGIVIENKGASLSLHYRNAPEVEKARMEIMLAVRRLTPLPRQISGKYVENILPQEALNKGEALVQIMGHAGTSRAVFVGDDDTDEDVFRMRDDRILGIRVGNSSPSKARYCLSDQKRIGRLIGEIMNTVTK